MGFKPQRKTYNLAFEDYPGLEVRAIGASLGELEKLNALSPEDPQNMVALMEFFDAKILEWNMEHPAVKGGGACSRCGLTEDTPVPPTATNMLCIDFDILLGIIMGWARTMARVAIPKEMSSSSGGSSGLGGNPSHGMDAEIMKRLAALQSPLT
jgi:hypothetical protein